MFCYDFDIVATLPIRVNHSVHNVGGTQTEKVMKALYVRKLFLWPRFQMSVKEALEERVTTPADVRF